MSTPADESAHAQTPRSGDPEEVPARPVSGSAVLSEETLAKLRSGAPNALTIVRIVLAAGVVALLSTLDLRGFVREDSASGLWAISHPAVGTLCLATALFVTAALTDALDGVLARRWHAISRFGRVMDPFADKILILGTFIVLAGPAFRVTHDNITLQLSGVAPWMVVVILARELLVTSIRGAYEADGIDFSAGPAGKIKMILQSIAAPIIMLLAAFANPLPGTRARVLVMTLVWATVIATIASAWPYIARAMSAARTAPTDDEAPKPSSRARAGRPTPDLGVPTERVEIPTARTKRRRPARAGATSRSKKR